MSKLNTSLATVLAAGLIGAMSTLTEHFDSARLPIAPQKFPSPDKPYVKTKRPVWHGAKSKKRRK